MCVLHHPFSKLGHFFAISTKWVIVLGPISKFTLLSMEKGEIGHIPFTVMIASMLIGDQVDPGHPLADFLWNSSAFGSFL